jgi:hypothetical protein
MSDAKLPLLSGPEGGLSLEERARAMEYPIFSCIARAMALGEDLMFDFRVAVPEEPNTLDWLTFLHLLDSKVHALYEQLLEQAMLAFVELDEEGRGIEAARMDIEEYLRSRVASYKEDDGLGLRSVDNNGDGS